MSSASIWSVSGLRIRICLFPEIVIVGELLGNNRSLRENDRKMPVDLCNLVMENISFHMLAFSILSR